MQGQPLGGVSPSPPPGVPLRAHWQGWHAGSPVRRGSKAFPCSTDSLLFPPLVFLEIVNEKSRHSLHENMGKIKVPTQVIWGKQDQVRGPCASPTGTHGLRSQAVAALRPAGTRVAPFPWVWTRVLGGVMDRKLRNGENQGWGGEGTDGGQVLDTKCQ